MTNILFIYFLALLLVCENTGQVKSFEIEDDEIDFFDLPSWSSERGSKVLVNVDGFGAVGDGVSDDTKVSNMLIVLVFTC